MNPTLRTRTAQPRFTQPRALRAERLEPRALLAGNGLTGQYFHNPDFTGLAVERTEAVAFTWGTAAPAAGVDGNSFSVRWTGQVEAEFSETYTFRTLSDEGVRLWVDGQLLIDKWTPHSLQNDSGTIALAAGQSYDVRLEYFDNAGSATIHLRWESASQTLEAIPADRLYANLEGLRGEYSDAFGGQATRVDAALDFDWGTARPLSGVAVDNFRVRWTGLVRPEFSELYTFSTLSDEGVRVWVGDELIIDHWDGHAAATQSGAKLLEAGKWYDLRVEYFDATGAAEIELSWASASQTDGQLEVISSEHLRAARHTPLLVTNPLGQGQDPWVIRWQDSYLHVRSSGNSVWIDQAAELQDIHSSTQESTSVRAWQAPPGTNYSHQIWAPELHQLDGKWYIYVAASDGNNATHRMHVLERNSPSPMGTYVYKGMIAASTDRWAIDGTVLEWQDKRYFIWSGWAGTVDGQQNLYIAEMSNPWTITGNRVLLAEPTAAWERHGLPINEGPQVLIHDGQLHIIYSGSGYWRQEYALGRLTYDGAGSIMNRSSWTKASGPVFQKTADIVGVGHASFTKSPDGSQDWIVYHAHPSPGGNADARVIRIQPFTFNANGTPNFGTPIFSNTVEVPSGVPDADGPNLPGDFDASGVVNAQDLNVWKAQFGGEKFPGHVVDGADFLTWQRQLSAVATGAATEQMAAASAVELTTASTPTALTTDRAAAGLASIAPSGPPRSSTQNERHPQSTPPAASRQFSPLQAIDQAFGEGATVHRPLTIGRDRSTITAIADQLGFQENLEEVGDWSGLSQHSVQPPPR